MTDVSDRPIGPSRRTLVRAGAALGWTAPVLLTAVPAHAACVSPNAAPRLVATVNITRPNGASGATARNRTFNVNVENQGGTYNGLLSVRLEAAGDPWFEQYVGAAPTGWTRSPASIGFWDFQSVVTFTTSSSVTLACGDVRTLAPVVRVVNWLSSVTNALFNVQVTAGATTVYTGTNLPATPV